ncbi:CCAAT/enhancer-binding protein gamma isoform X1 [Dendropsophus ebraccatus]|uniref:CCAAT/enhancer-binding protein gamma isoform X1 n=2 Tax=Dendropsophus ebraccatus TaxID=150705 RepID=UPI0038321692
MEKREREQLRSKKTSPVTHRISQRLKMNMSPSSSDDNLSNSQLSSPPTPQLVPEGGGKATPPSKSKKGQRMDRGSEEYRLRRERNNIAVKKSRLKSKQKAQDTLQRVNQLKEENERLEAKIKLLTKELSVLKDLFLEHAHNLAESVPPETSATGQEQPTP